MGFGSVSFARCCFGHLEFGGDSSRSVCGRADICGVMVLVISQSAASPARSRAESRMAALTTQIDSIRKRNAALSERLEYRKSRGFILETAKRELMLAQPGEISLKIDGALPIDLPRSSLPATSFVPERQSLGLLDFGYLRAWRQALFVTP